MDTLYIYDESDFDKVRNLANKQKTIKIVIGSDIIFNKLFKPIDNKEDYTIIIEGNDNILSKMRIYKTTDKVGIFTKVKNIKVSHLVIADSYVYGGLLSGTICGDVTENAEFDTICIANGLVSATAYCGGVVGSALNLSIKDSNILSTVYGANYVGGIAGMIHDYTEENIDVDSVIIGTGNGTALGSKIGLCDYKTIIPNDLDFELTRDFHS